MSINSDLRKFLSKKKISRRGFVKLSFLGLFALVFSGWLPRLWAKEETKTARKKNTKKGDYDLVLAGGEHPYHMTLKAIQAMGGMKRFVNKGS